MARIFERPSPWRRIAPWFRGFDYWLGLAFVILLGAGLMIMYSSGYGQGSRFGDHLRNSVIACLVLFIVAQLPPQRLLELAVPLYLLGLALLIAVALFGVTRKGATRWLYLGVSIQPSELMKIAVPLMLAWWFQRREGQMRFMDFLIAFTLLALPVWLIMRQPDLGTALLVLAGGLAVVFFAGLSWRLIAPPVILALLGIVLLLVFEPRICAAGVDWPLLRDYQQQRVCTLLDPARDPLGKGFHIIQGMIAIGSGGFWGKGFMQGTQTHLEFIPERTTDFIFAAFSEEFGLFGNMALIGAFLLLILRALLIALDAPTVFTRLLAGSVAVIFFSYAFVNMGMVSGILPVVGVPLPFISYGGTAMVTLGLGLGILMSIGRSKRLIQT